MILFPISTDAPIYHRPIGTIALIVANVAVFALTASDLHEAVDQYGLHHGAGFTPVEWVTSNFIHGGFIHLLGNMVFLWGFGLIVEGKIGTLNFLGIYLGIGVAECLLEQAIFTHSPGISFGASAIIFGLMSISLIWAPQNELSVFYWLFFRFVGVFDLSVVAFAALKMLMSGLIIIIFLMIGFPPGGELLHLMGAGIGAVVGFVYLKAKLVDCEGWDILTVISGKTPTSEKYLSQSYQEAMRRRANASKAKRKRSVDLNKKLDRSKPSPARFAQLLDENKSNAAYAELERIRHHKPEWTPTQEQLISLARGLRTASNMRDAVKAYLDFIELNSEFTLAKLELAEIFVFVQERPSAALRLLEQCDVGSFSDKQKKRHQQATLHAQSMISDGIIEIDFQS